LPPSHDEPKSKGRDDNVFITPELVVFREQFGLEHILRGTANSLAVKRGQKYRLTNYPPRERSISTVVSFIALKASAEIKPVWFQAAVRKRL